MIKNITRFVLVAFVLTFIPVNNANACSMVYMTEEEAFDAHGIVFVGTVTSVDIGDGPYDNVTAVLDVDNAYKGVSESSSVTVTTSKHGSMCGLGEDAFDTGDVWVIFSGSSYSPNYIFSKEYSSISAASDYLDSISDSDDSDQDNIDDTTNTNSTYNNSNITNNINVSSNSSSVGVTILKSRNENSSISINTTSNSKANKDDIVEILFSNSNLSPSLIEILQLLILLDLI